jgi:two-component system, sporulation sensor kinase E
MKALLLASAISEGKEIRTELADIPTVLADENEIRQCLLNFARNALDAMDQGGQITISTHWDGRINVRLSVSDNGSGIPPAVYEKLGTPFLTTKEKGTGLGLSVCYQIARRNNAEIEVETGPAGTTFSLKFKIT